MPPSVPRWQAELILLGVTLIWGGTFALVKGALSAIPPFLFTGIRFLLALVVLFLLRRDAFHRWERQILRAGLLLGGLLAGGFLLQVLGLLFTSASRSAFITGATVVLVPAMQLLVQRRRVLLTEWLGAAAALLGLWQLTNPRFGVWNLGDVLTAASTLFWALYVVALDMLTRPLLGTVGASVQLTSLQFATTAVAAFLAHVFTQPLELFSPPLPSWWTMPSIWIALGYTAVLASVVATLAQTHYQRYTTPARAALIYTLEPVFATAIAALVLQERLQLHEAFGAAIIFLGILLAQLPRLRFSHLTG